MGSDIGGRLSQGSRRGGLSRRTLLKGAAAGASAAALLGGRTIVPVRAQDAAKVTFWTTFTEPDLSVLKGMVETYNKQAQGHQVELTQIPPAQVTDVTKLMTAVRGGTGPDVYHLDRFIVAQYAAAGLLQELNSLMGGTDVMANYIGFARDEATYNGKAYALPFDTDARALYYNVEMMKAAGADPAELDQKSDPITWDRLAELGTKLNEKDANGNYTKMGFIPWLNQGWHYTYGFSWGGSFYDQAACKVTPNDPKIVEAFKWVQDDCVAQGADAVSAFGSPSMQPGFDNSQHPFVLAKLGAQITGDWYLNQMKQYAPNLEYGVTWMPVPKKGDPSVTWAGGWSVVIPQGAKNVNDAWTFMQWMAGEPGQRIYTTGSSHLPTWSSLLDDASLFEGQHVFFAQMLKSAKNRPPLPVGAKYWDELTTAWQKVYLNQEAPDKALDEVAQRVQADLQKFC